MKLLFSCVCAFAMTTVSLAAYAFDLKDPAILGEYTLAQPDRNVEIQRAELVYNADNQLVVRMERGPGEYELSKPDGQSIVFNGEDEFNCGGEESECSYDSSTVIKLLSTRDANGRTIPQLSIHITVAYAWAEDCDNDKIPCEDTELDFVLNWNKPLKYNIPFYTNFENAKLQRQESQCKERLEDVVFESRGTAYLNPYDICGRSNSFKYRDDFKVAFPYLLQDWLGGNEKQPREITATEVSAYFAQAKALAKTYNSPGIVTSTMIVEELEKLEAYVLRSDRFFYVPPMDGSSDDMDFFVVDTANKVVVKLNLKVK